MFQEKEQKCKIKEGKKNGKNNEDGKQNKESKGRSNN